MKLLVVGWEVTGAAAPISLIGTGRLPALAALRRRGRLAWLSGLARPCDSASWWTSLVSGKRPTKHQVLGSTEIAPGAAGFAPVGRRSRRALSVWEIAAQAGLSAHAINWLASYPAVASGGGTVVSDRFFCDARDDAVYPAGDLAALKPMRVAPDEIDDAALAPLLPRPTPPGIGVAMRRFIAAAASVQAVATFLLEHRPADVVAVRFPALGANLAHPAAVAGALQFLDATLARLVVLGGGDCCTALLTLAAGGKSGEQARRLNGGDGGYREAFAVMGPADVAVDGRISCSAYDVAPTLLAHLGVGSAADMDGRANPQLLPAIPELEPRISWEVGAPREMEDDRAGADSSIQHLLALGYREHVDPYAQHAVRRHERQRRLGLAMAHLDAKEPGRAIEILEPLADANTPDRAAVRTVLAEAYFYDDRREPCRGLVESLIEEGFDTPLAHLALAALDAREREPERARQHLQIVRQRAADDAWILEAVGRVYLQLGDNGAAEEALDAALRLGPDRPSVRQAMAQLALARGDPELALAHASIAAAARPDDMASQYQRGVSLLRLRRYGEAAGALAQAARLDHHRSAAVLWQLADALEQAGDVAAAQQHRLLARQRRLQRQARSADRTNPLDHFAAGLMSR